MKKLYFFPSEPLSGYQNPYCKNFKESISKYYKVLDMQKSSKVKRMFTLLINSFYADIIIFNWLESIPFFPYGKIQFYINIIALQIIKIRKCKIVMMFHNLSPHTSNNWQSKYLMKWLFSNATIIVTHSKEAEMVAKNKTKKPIYFITHPINNIKVVNYETNKDIDIFIWGTVSKYKGIYEFISLPFIQNSPLKIYILGKSQDKILERLIKSACNHHIHYDNRKANFNEIAYYCQNSKYVLFPYIGNCISSSGALIDTLLLKGTPIGPNRGAFKDLSEEGLCFVYNDYTELKNVLNETRKIDESKRMEFLNKHSWENFAYFLSTLLK